MIRTDFKIARRSVFANRFFSVVNIVGLTIGISTSILISLWVQNELSFDKSHTEKDRTYRLISHIDVGHEVMHWSSTPLKLSHHAKAEIPEIEEIVVLRNGSNKSVFELADGQLFVEEDLAFIDQNWLEEFEYQVLQGSIEDFNRGINSLALTQDLSEKYFGSGEALGKIVRFDSADYQVNLILAENPSNSSFQFKAFIPLRVRWLDAEHKKNDDSWGNYDYITFVRMRPDEASEIVAAKLTEILNVNKENNKTSITLEGLSNIRFSQIISNDVFDHQNKTAVHIFALIGLLILIIAGLNYTNLSAALLSKRVKEIGIKKIIGASFANIFRQIIFESLIITAMSFLFAIMVVKMTLPFVENVLGVQISLLNQPIVWLLCTSIIIINVIIAGVYPAWIFGIFKAKNFISRNNESLGGSVFRKSMVTFQFVLTIAMLVCTVVIQQQLSYIQDKDVGYDRSHVLEIKPNLFKGDFKKNLSDFSLYASELRKNREFEGLALTSGSIVSIQSSNAGNFEWEGMEIDFEAPISTFSVDENIQSVFNLEMSQGRWFETGHGMDRGNIILNESAIRKFQIPAPVVGRKAKWRNVEGQIVGVVKDFHFKSLHEPIEPLLISTSNSWNGTILAKIHSQHIQTGLDMAREKFEEIFPSQPFEYTFLDETYQRMHDQEAKMGFLFKWFAGILVFISCLGLFGLTTFAVHRRTKEIGIRKVLGASISNIVAMLSNDFIRLILIAALMAIPIAWYFMSRWLQGFAYRINMQWWMFLIAGALVVVIALLTSGVQSMRAAMSNPVDTLRAE